MSRQLSLRTPTLKQGFRFFGSKGHTEEFFAPTLRRCLLRDHEHHDALRYQKFDVEALSSVIASSTGAESVADLCKIAERRGSNIFKAQLSDGRNVLAQITTPRAGSPHLVTASEVATMRFLRERLGLEQVPRVISWSSRAEGTPVGAEFIVMDIPDGVALETVWHTLTVKQKLTVVHQWVQLESRMINALRENVYGSLYHRGDIPSEQALPLYIRSSNERDPDFVLGPATTMNSSWETKHYIPPDLRLELDRGPWSDIKPYLRAISNCERTLIQSLAKPPSRAYTAPWEPPARLKDPSSHIRLLDMFDKVAQSFVPREQKSYRPTLAHWNASPENIILSQDALNRDGTIEISAVVGWQHTAVRPLYLCAEPPSFIAHAGPAPEQEIEAFQKEQDDLLRAYGALYTETDWDPTWASALNKQDINLLHDLPTSAQYCWHGGYVRLVYFLIVIARSWETLLEQKPGKLECPLGNKPFSDAEIKQVDQDEAQWQAALAEEYQMDGKIGLDDQGCVDVHQYDRAMQINRELFEEWSRSVDLGNIKPSKIWPYRLD